MSREFMLERIARYVALRNGAGEGCGHRAPLRRVDLDSRARMSTEFMLERIARYVALGSGAGEGSGHRAAPEITHEY